MAQSNLEYFVKNEFSKNQYPSIWPQNGPTKFDLKKMKFLKSFLFTKSFQCETLVQLLPSYINISFQLQQLKKKFTKNKKVLT
jgi:hypothetical protein